MSRPLLTIGALAGGLGLAAVFLSEAGGVTIGWALPLFTLGMISLIVGFLRGETRK